MVLRHARGSRDIFERAGARCSGPLSLVRDLLPQKPGARYVVGLGFSLVPHATAVPSSACRDLDRICLGRVQPSMGDRTAFAIESDWPRTPLPLGVEHHGKCRLEAELCRSGRGADPGGVALGDAGVDPQGEREEPLREGRATAASRLAFRRLLDLPGQCRTDVKSDICEVQYRSATLSKIALAKCTDRRSKGPLTVTSVER